MSFSDEILTLVELKTEGDYWDFKAEWHDNNADLLHDIICMANNLVNRDAYLIIGVTDSKHPDGVRIIGVPEQNRKNQQNLIDFLKSVKFAGDIRPTVYLQTITFVEGDVDVIIIKNTQNTPYYLLEPYNAGKKCVQSGHIYTRIGDTNTPQKNVADIDKVEYLWKKRFGIDLPVLEKLSLLLDRPEDWEGSFSEKDRIFHRICPEFQICLIDSDEDFSNNSIVHNIADHNPDTSFAPRKLVITYHSTVLHEEYVFYFDGYRHLMPLPQTCTIFDNSHEINQSITYLYFDKSTIQGKLFACCCQSDHIWYIEPWDMIEGVAFITFENEVEKEQFDDFLRIYRKEILEIYDKALASKGCIRSQKTESYFISGWSKANEIKAEYAYRKYKGLPPIDIEARLP